MNYSALEIKPSIAMAQEEGRGIVALESTIIAHGLPYPDNLKIAKEIEDSIRAVGAVPATIALFAGKMKVGLDDSELMYLAKNGQQIMKCSRRDLPVMIARGLNGATTVAATMMIAEMVGIRIFATGGIGGVHREAHITMDISADLQELARTNVAVVSAGAKAILDIGLTLEYLETFGVPVIGYQTDSFPIFYTRKSPFSVPHRLNSPKAIAEVIHVKNQMNARGGILIANPIPPASEMRDDEVWPAVNAAIQKAREKGIHGKALTPYLLNEIKEATQGSSVISNAALVLNNAALAASIAKHLAKIEGSQIV